MTPACVFCGGSPTTREHVWPAWAGRLVQEAGPVTHHQQIDQEGREQIRRGWIDRPFSMTVNVVCARCNNEWMERLEDGARPYLETMLNGRGRDLHEGGQRALAAWVVKTALMFEHTQPVGGRIFPNELYSYLHEHGCPPSEMRVWIAAYTGNWPAFGHAYGLDTDADDKDPYRNRRDVYGATIALGPVAFQTFGTTVSRLAEGITSSAGHIVHQLWPYQGSFTWTPTPAFDDHQLVRFADDIAERIVRDAQTRAP